MIVKQTGSIPIVVHVLHLHLPIEFRISPTIDNLL